MPVDYETPTVYVRPDVESSEEFKALGLKQSGRFVPESRAKIIYGGYDFDGSLEDARAQMERLLDQLGRGRKPRIR